MTLTPPSSFASWASGAATGTQPEIARGDHRVDIGDSSASFADSVRLRLNGHVPGGALDGLFGWTLPAS